MGWDESSIGTKAPDYRQFFQDLLGEEETIVDSFLDRGDGAFYMAVRHGKARSYHRAGDVLCVVGLVEYAGPGWIRYKVLHEVEGPAASRCPARILDMLSPTEAPYALKWRERCRRNAAPVPGAEAEDEQGPRP